jgi:hypothetical protein
LLKIKKAFKLNALKKTLLTIYADAAFSAGFIILYKYAAIAPPAKGPTI